MGFYGIDSHLNFNTIQNKTIHDNMAKLQYNTIQYHTNTINLDGEGG